LERPADDLVKRRYEKTTADEKRINKHVRTRRDVSIHFLRAHDMYSEHREFKRRFGFRQKHYTGHESDETRVSTESQDHITMLLNV